MDIGASIRSHAKTIRASELASRHERVRVLNMATIKSLIMEAVEEAASSLTRSLGEAERKGLLLRELDRIAPTPRGYDLLSDLQALFLPDA